jgi:ribosomal-protein-alanine N-acetyltransferase
VSGPAALRSYRETDLPALHALDGVCFLPDISYTRQELKHFLEHPGAFSIVAEQDGRIAGFSPTLRRRGIGVQLMQWIIAQAARLGAQALVLEAAVDNRPAHLFYERFGFTVTGTIPGYYNGLVDAFAFERLVLPQEAPATTA